MSGGKKLTDLLGERPAGHVAVTELLGGRSFGDKTYPHFQASKERPAMWVPQALADVLNLPLHDEEVQAREAVQVGQEADGEGVDVQVILKANQDLKADLDKVTGERDELQRFSDEAQRIFTPVAGDGGKGESGLEAMQRIVNERNALKVELATAQARIAELESAKVTNLTAEPGAARTRIAELKAAPQSPEKSDGATPLVDGLPLSDLLTGNNITTMEALEAGLIVPEGADQSPVEAISGIGKKTVEAYTKAVADWRKGQAN